MKHFLVFFFASIQPANQNFCCLVAFLCLRQIEGSAALGVPQIRVATTCEKHQHDVRVVVHKHLIVQRCIASARIQDRSSVGKLRQKVMYQVFLTRTHGVQNDLICYILVHFLLSCFLANVQGETLSVFLVVKNLESFLVSDLPCELECCPAVPIPGIGHVASRHQQLHHWARILRLDGSHVERSVEIDVIAK